MDVKILQKIVILVLDLVQGEMLLYVNVFQNITNLERLLAQLVSTLVLLAVVLLFVKLVKLLLTDPKLLHVLVTEVIT